jgi:hypothetical protein
MLYERRSASQKSMGMPIQQSLVGTGVTLGGAGIRRPHAVDPTRYYDIPPAGPSIGNPRFDL